MKNNKLVGNLFWGVVSDLPIPGSSTAKAVYDSFLEKRKNVARKILLEEIKEGTIPLEELATKDEFIAILYRYSLAVVQARAEHNLRLLAKVMGKQVSSGDLDPDKFHQYANILETLTEDDVKLLGIMFKFYTPPDFEYSGEYRDKFLDRAWRVLNKQIGGEGFSSRAHIDAICGGLIRTGLLLPKIYWDGMHYHLSVAGEELYELAIITPPETNGK